MMSLGIVLALNHLYNNWTIAGTMSAAYILAVSAVTPFYARLFDRLGQRRVGFPVLGLQVTSMLVFAFAAMARVPIAVLFVLAILMGLCQYPIGCVERNSHAGGIVGISTFPGHDRGLVGGGDRVSVCARMYENRPHPTLAVYWNGRERGENRPRMLIGA